MEEKNRNTIIESEKTNGDDRRTVYKDFQDYEERQTRLVEKQRKPYKGFITDEELKNDKIIDRSERRQVMDEVPFDMKETRVYRGLGTGLDTGEEEEKEPARKPKIRTFKIADSNKFKRLIAILCIFALLIIFDISYFVMKGSIGKLPERTARVKSETIEVESANKKIKKESSQYGDYNDVKELKESWERLRDKISESE